MENGDFNKAIELFGAALEISGKLTVKNGKEVEENLKNLIFRSKSNKIKATISALRIRFPRLRIIEIAEESSEKEELILSVVLEMIKNKEIRAKYFESTKSLVFDQALNNNGKSDLIFELNSEERNLIENDINFDINYLPKLFFNVKNHTLLNCK